MRVEAVEDSGDSVAVAGWAICSLEGAAILDGAAERVADISLVAMVVSAVCLEGA